MRTVGGVVWALALGLAFTLIAGGVAIAGTTAAPAPAVAQELGIGSDFSVEPWPGIDTISSEIARDLPRDDPGNITIAMAARWGYLDDPAVWTLGGRWRFNDTGTGGEFAGEWHLTSRRLGGTLHGRFSLPADGLGQFRGVWTVGDSREGGSLWGSWTRLSHTHGSFDGQWDYADGREGGALTGGWAHVTRDAGGFRGHAIAAPSIAPVDWDGVLRTTEGAVGVLRTVRFERDDHVLPRTDRQSVAWESTTTVNWDGILFVLRIPKGDPGPNVTLRTTQISFEWTARELDGLRVRERVDRAGHAIEVVAFIVGRPPTDYARIEIGMRWGNLSSRDGDDSLGTTVTSWDGFAQITYGGLEVARVVSFERGDAILPRDNRVTVVWHSSTSGGWDGVVVIALIPLTHAEDTYFTVHAGPFTHVFTLRELPGDHLFDAGNGGQVEVRAVRG